MGAFFSTRCIEKTINKNSITGNLIAILGNSHPKTAINDSLLEKQLKFPVKNYGVNGQSMFWTIVAGRKLYDQGVRTFIIELNNGSYTSGWKTTDKLIGTREFNNRHYLKWSEWNFLWDKSPSFTSRMFLYFHWPSRKVNGSFVKLNKKFNNQIVKSNKPILIEGMVVVDFDDEMLHNFIQEHTNASFIILRAPLHPKYFDKFSPNLETKFQERLQSFNVYQNSLVFDFGHLYKDDKYFADLGHMNTEGAFQFSKQLKDSLKGVTKLFQKKPTLLK